MKNSTATSLLETVKVVFAVVAMCLLLNTVNAQSTMPVNAVTHKVCYTFRVPVAAGVSNEKAFETVQGWVSQNTRVFNRTNDLFAMNAATNDDNKSFVELEQTFSNAQPLQSIDPESNRIAARVMVKYQSANSNRCMQMMYVQYYLVLTIKDNAIEAEVTDIRYNHFNKKNFQLMRINNWTDYTSCEAISTMEYLIENEHCHEEFAAFATFFNADVAKLQNQLAAFVQGSQILTLNK